MKQIVQTFFSCILLLNNISVLAADRLQIVVSILPQKYFVEQITHDEADIHVMVNAGDNPTTYEPKPSQMALVSKADIYFTIGVPFEQAWMKRVQQLNPNMKIIPTGNTSGFTVADHHGHDHDDDPHIWTSPEEVKVITQKIVNALVQLKSAQNNIYQSRLNTFQKQLTQLDKSITDKTARLKNRTLIVTHPAWSHFANRYSLKQLSIEQKGKTIKAASLKSLIEFAKENNIRAVFGQPQFSNKAATIVAREIDADIYMLDPLAYDYINNMTQMTEVITGALMNE